MEEDKEMKEDKKVEIEVEKEMKHMAKHDASRAMKRCNYLLSEIEAVYHEIAWKLGMSDSAINILYAICDHGERCPLQTVCRYAALSKQTVNSALRKMEAEGILYLEPDGPKNKTVCLTEKGKRLMERTAGRVLKAENEIFEAWPPEDVQKYLELTERYLQFLRNSAKTF